MRMRTCVEFFKDFYLNCNGAKQKFSSRVMAGKALLTAKGACFGFSKVASSSEREKATS